MAAFQEARKASALAVAPGSRHCGGSGGGKILEMKK